MLTAADEPHNLFSVSAGKPVREDYHRTMMDDLEIEKGSVSISSHLKYILYYTNKNLASFSNKNSEFIACSLPVHSTILGYQ